MSDQALLGSVVKFYERPLIITDVETTGLDPQRHEIIDIGAIRVDQNLNVAAELSVKIFPEHIETAEPEALAINGYDRIRWFQEMAVVREEAMRQFSNFSASGVLVAWNITFEYTFLNAMFRAVTHAAKDNMDYHRIDIPSIVWYTMPGLEKIDLDAIGKLLGMVDDEPRPHTGIGGARRELEVLRRLRTYGASPTIYPGRILEKI